MSSAGETEERTISANFTAVSGPARRAAQLFFRLSKTQRCVRDTHNRDPCVSNVVARQFKRYRNTCKREVTKAARDFFECPAGVRRQGPET